MKLFVIVCENPNPRLEQAVKGLFPRDYMRLSFNAWMVSSPDSAEQISKQLGIFDGSNGAGLVVGVASYYGRAPKKTRDWITKRFPLPAADDGGAKDGEAKDGKTGRGMAKDGGGRPGRVARRR